MTPRRKRWLIIGLLGVMGIVFAVLGWNTVRLWLAWRNVERFDFDPATVREQLEARSVVTTPPGDEPNSATPTTVPPAVIPPDAFDAYLAVGSDESPNKDSVRSDAILLFLLSRDGTGSLLVSIPRDMSVMSPCHGEPSRLAEMLEGCGDLATGPELLTIAVEDFTGMAIKHFVIFGFEGFRETIDRLDGVRICVDNPVRLRAGAARLLDAGCTLADGETALSWLRARAPQELIEEEWRAIESLGDAGRNHRQQQFLIELLRELKAFTSVTSLTSLVEDLSDAFILDDDLSLGRAVSLIWELRSLDPREIERLVFPATPGATLDGEFVLTPDRTFVDVVLEQFPELAAPG